MDVPRNTIVLSDFGWPTFAQGTNTDESLNMLLSCNGIFRNNLAEFCVGGDTSYMKEKKLELLKLGRTLMKMWCYGFKVWKCKPEHKGILNLDM